MLLKLASKIFGSSNERVLKKYRKNIDIIAGFEEKFSSMTDEELRGQTDIFRERLKSGESLDDIRDEAFAVIREAGKRTLGLRHFDVQMIGGMVLHDGAIAEMRTGEGKTLVATLAVYLNALEGKGVHVITVNDYLAKRDSEWMGKLYKFMGLTVGCIVSNIPDAERKAAYEADVTYGTNNEFGFDYLRDNMKFRLEDMVQREFNYAIVDEVDSILIDEARTPLIISGPSESNTDLYVKVDKLIPLLDECHYDIDEKMKTVNLNDEGSERIEQLLVEHGILTDGGLYDAANIELVHHVNSALKAHHLFEKDKEYIVKDNKVIIIDEFTGRMMEGRRFSEGLHQALEAKEGVPIQNENQTLASITFQNYFRLYPKLAGMTGTAMTEATEFKTIYNLDVVEIPTNVEVKRIDHDDKIYKTLDEKYNAIVEIIKDCNERGQPVLIGTVSIEKSEYLSKMLKKLKIKHNILNARYHEQEAYIIGQAGRLNAVTIATNMAGRGTDIKLGGNADMRIEQEVDPSLPEEKRQKAIDKIIEEIKAEEEEVKACGGLCVIGTERHESRRIDNQLRGRSGRQGDPGDTYFFLSLQDDLMRIFSPDALEMVLGNKSIGLKDGEALAHPWLSKALEKAQARVEVQNFEIRKNLLKFDNVMNDQRKVIYEQRREIMASDTVEDIVTDMRHEVIEDMVRACIPPNAYAEQWDIDTLCSETSRILALDLPIADWAKEEGIADEEIIERIKDASDAKMAAKAASMSPNIFRQIEKSFVLQTLDSQWKEHLLNLDHLRQGIGLRQFAQRDPLNEFKAEAFSMFSDMLDNIREAIVQNLSIVEFNVDESRIISMEEQMRNKAEGQKISESRANIFENKEEVYKTGTDGTVIKRVKNSNIDKNDPSTWGRVQRNAPCPCGSGKKYKQCHGKL